MEKPVAERLRGLGVDVELLLFLEGAEGRLARIHRAGEIADSEYVAAIRAAVWLCSQFPDPQDRAATREWIGRYEGVQGLLWNAIRYSMTAHRHDRASDLESLESVLEKLLPLQARAQIRRDIQTLRKQRKPERPDDRATGRPPPRAGGRRQSEQVQRMRAAVTHLQRVSKRPYKDLAELWNEGLGQIRYSPEGIRQLLRKGPESGEQLLELWARCFRGDYRAVFPGELSEGIGPRSADGGIRTKSS